MYMRYPVLTLILFIFSVTSFAGNWKRLSDGIEYQELDNKTGIWSHIHVFRISLDKNDLKIITAKEISKNYASADEFANNSHALIAINGGFFDKKFKPLGLRISNFKQINPIKRISWWGILYTKKQQANLATYRSFKNNRQVNFAIQSGPRLIVDSNIPPLKPGSAERTAIGYDSNNNIIMLVTDNASMTTTELANIMKSSPLNCTDALNLDGGSSSQLYASIGAFKLNVHGFSEVSDAIIVVPNSRL